MIRSASSSEPADLALTGSAAATSGGTPAPSHHRQAFGNVATNLLNLVVSLFIGLWLAPYLIVRLGAGGYGLVPLASNIAQNLSILTVGATSAVGRLVSVSLTRDDESGANGYFSSALVLAVIAAIVLMAVGAFASLYIDRLIRIPVEFLSQTRYLFLFTFAALALTAVRTTFSVATFYRNRLDLRNWVEIGGKLLRVGIIYVLFEAFYPLVWIPGLATLLMVLFDLAGNVVLWRKLTPGLRCALGRVNLRSMREIFSIGGWVTINTAGALLFLNVDLLVVNRVLGPDPAGRYAALLQMPIVIRGLATAIATGFAPSIILAYSRRRRGEMVATAEQAMRIQTLLILPPVAFLAAAAAPFLRVWLGEEFAALDGVLVLCSLHLGLNLVAMPLFTLQLAEKRLVVPALATISFGVVNVLLSIFLTRHIGLAGTALSGLIGLTLKNAIFTTIYTAVIAGEPWHRFLRTLARSSLALAAATLSMVVLARLLPVDTWFDLIVLIGGSCLLYLPIGLFVVLTRGDRTAIGGFLRARF